MNQKTEKSGLSASEVRWLFWGCFIALVATSFAFVIRNIIIGDWGMEFNLSETQKGELLGVGLWPFGVSIVLFSLIADKIGYGRAMVFAFACHLVSAILTVSATSYWMLYAGTFLVAFGNGTVEAVINPVIATVYPKEKTKWLNILHAGWPGGMVIGGVITLLVLGPDLHWRWKAALIFIPLAVYGLILLRCKFPVQERVQAGVPYKVMLQEAGIIGAVIIVALLIGEIGRVFEWSYMVQFIVGGILVVAYAVSVKSLGRPLFIFLLLIMIPLATTELGTDSWITQLVEPIMVDLGAQAGWVIVYTAFIMTVLRFLAGPIVERLQPLGLLAISSVLAIIGLLFLSKAAGIVIFVAATVYGIGKTFFWPTMLGIVAERFPKGGALTLNMISGVAMLSVGVIGAAFLGNIQDREIDRDLQSQNPALHAQIVAPAKVSVFGKYNPLDQKKVAEITPEEKSLLKTITSTAKQNALATVAIFPAIMLVCYIILIFYFRSKGGYKPVEISHASGASP
ncbi:MAG: MFS transporter [Deferribacteres bacterium]|nr:MFS transporter [candidate division KSB1 bacterium]MCB9501999.1 MFS transporter [Deferribacteres bacterium]